MNTQPKTQRRVHRRLRLLTMGAILLGAATLVGTVVASGSRPDAPQPGRAPVHGDTRRGSAESGGQGVSGAAGATDLSATFGPEGPIAHGIYEFGTNSGADAENPDLAGTTLTFEWSELEPQPGVFAWGRVDQAIAPWAAAGKHVILRVSTAGEASWGASAANATPEWVYAQGAQSVNDGGTLPVYWNATYLQDYDSFIAAFAAQFDGDPAASFIEMGIGDGGETLPDTQEGPGDRYAIWTPYGYSDAVWLDTIESIATTYREDFPLTPVVPLVDSSFLGPSRAAEYATLTSWFVANGFPMQYDGLTSRSTPQNPSWGKTATIVEQRNSTSKSGDTLAGDCAAATGPMDSNVILIYQSDIDNPANGTALGYCADSAAS